MSNTSPRGLQFAVFALVAAAFTNIYITQPVLPVLQREFGASPTEVSFTVAAVILGVALANLPFGRLADRVDVRRLILAGGVLVAVSGLVCAVTENLWLLVAARFVQGLFIPAVTTSLAAHLSRSLPLERLNVVMGAYISATVAGGLGGRLLGGWLHPPAHWRWAFVTTAALLLAATLFALRVLPRPEAGARPEPDSGGYLDLLRRPEILRIYAVAFAAFFVFSSLFNYLPFRLEGPPFGLPTGLITLIYLAYVVGIGMGPLAGRLSNRYGNAATLLGGTLVLGGSIGLTLLPSLWAVVIGLVGICAGFFAMHAAAAGSLNRRLSGSRGRANALYVLFYYLGGWTGISVCGLAWSRAGWGAVVSLDLALLAIPLAVAWFVHRQGRGSPASG